MSRGICSLFADASFSNLLMEFKRIADICSNIGIATVIRVRPELADHEHLYYESLQTSGEEAFMNVFNAAHDKYFGMLEQRSEAIAQAQAEAEALAVETNKDKETKKAKNKDKDKQKDKNKDKEKNKEKDKGKGKKKD